LLDEIGDMPLSLQAKILRVLQEQAFQRVGGVETVRTDVRVIAATHHDLRALAAEGKFRADLYYRLAVCTIHLPPLRERGDDLHTLVRHFVARYGREFGKNVRDVAPDAMAKLRAHPWPGNVRELQSVLKQALLRTTGAVLTAAALPDLSAATPGATQPASDALDLAAFVDRHLALETKDLYAQAHGEVDRVIFTRVLEHTGGNHRHAARLLGIARQTMRTKLRALGLRVTHAVASDSDDD
jgi:two-component system nitrogen regulation response regulator GlnG